MSRIPPRFAALLLAAPLAALGTPVAPSVPDASVACDLAPLPEPCDCPAIYRITCPEGESGYLYDEAHAARIIDVLIKSETPGSPARLERIDLAGGRIPRAEALAALLQERGVPLQTAEGGTQREQASIIRATFDRKPAIYSLPNDGYDISASETKWRIRCSDYLPGFPQYVSGFTATGICGAANMSCIEVASETRFQGTLLCDAISQGVCPPASLCASEQSALSADAREAALDRLIRSGTQAVVVDPRTIRVRAPSPAPSAQPTTDPPTANKTPEGR